MTVESTNTTEVQEAVKEDNKVVGNIVNFERLDNDILFDKIKEKLPLIARTPKIIAKLEAVNYVKDKVMFATISFELDNNIEIISVPFNIDEDELQHFMTDEVLEQNLFKQSKEYFILMETCSNDLKDDFYENFSGLLFTPDGTEVSENVQDGENYKYVISFV